MNLTETASPTAATAPAARRRPHRSLRRAALLAVTAAVTAAAAPALANATADPTRIVDPGSFTARVTPCTAAAAAACGGDYEINGELYDFAGGRLRGTVTAAGALSHTKLTFGTASTDPAVDGPLQLTLTAVTVGSGSGGFGIGNVPGGAANPAGLIFGYRQDLFLRVGGAGIGVGCTIGSPAQPLVATFLDPLSGFFGGTPAGATYDQQSGTTSVSAVLQSIPGVADCGGQAATIDGELGLPGPGSIAMHLSFHPVLQTNVYRAAR